MTVRPSETSQGARWIQNFRLDERAAATMLIDSLRVISSSSFRVTMASALRAAVDKCDAPVGVYPARELRGNDSDGLSPLDHPFAATPGSEGLVGNIIRDVVGRKPRLERAASYGSLERLRQRRVRTLLLVDDYSGTGDQLVKYVDAWAEHPTIKSWHSYGLLRIHVLLMAASMQARQRLDSHRFVTDVRCVEHGVGFDSAPWTDREREAIESLCKRYAHKPEYALGYHETRGLLVLHHTVPNNLPHILWQTKCPKLRGWVPLFGDRTMTPRLQVELYDYRLETDPKRIAEIIQQERLAEALDAQPNPTVQIFLLVLGAVEHGCRDPRKLGNLLSLTLEAVQRTLEACRELRLLDSESRLTNEGRSELHHARRHRPIPQPDLASVGDDALYYPVTLRGAG